MKAFHVIVGVPRSGSTLLCNLLNQNPDFYASSTSFLAETIALFTSRISTSAETQSQMHKDFPVAVDKFNRMAKGLVENWYESDETYSKVVFDKCRGWPYQALLLGVLYPETKIIACVRDLRAVAASIEKQHRKSPVLDPVVNVIEKTVYARIDSMMSPGGLIGLPVIGLQDMMLRRPEAVLPVRYNAFAGNPKETLQEIYDFIGLPYFEKHQFDDVKNTAEDLDALYLGKFPHKGDGKVVKPKRDEWKEFVPKEIAELVFQRYPLYNSQFGFSG